MKTGKGTPVIVVFNDDVEPNKGGYWCEVLLHEGEDRIDDFCIHPEDCDCSNWAEVLQYAYDYMQTVTEY